MRALFFDKELKYLSVFPLQPRRKGDASVKVLLAGICSTDLEIVDGYKDFKGVLGHEFVGVVHDATSNELVGKRVVGEINVGCGQCASCRRGKKNHCENRKAIGIQGRDGCFADYINIPEENLHVLPDDMVIDRAVFVEPLAAAMNVIMNVWIKPNERVVVIGDGKLGILTAQVVKMTGADVDLIGKHKKKLSIVDWLGIENYQFAGVEKDSVIVKNEGGKEEKLKKSKYDIVIECSGSSSGLEVARRLIMPGGRIVLKSTVKEEAMIDMTYTVVNELQIVGSRCGPFEPAIRAIRKGFVEVRPLITSRFPLEDWKSAFETAKKPESLKVILAISES